MKYLGRPEQYACFICRKCFKRNQENNFGLNHRFMTSEQSKAKQLEEKLLKEQRIYKCPDCGSIAHHMGIDFKAPKKTDIKAWQEVESFILSGRIYYRGSQDKDRDIH
ncbi:hypothetical protein [Aquirhabdus sp.]|uniref:hypothetical protein n=1 Tax=Aquirhabdus sp. TaxID=2824160 RepID=UPI00396CA8C6